MKLGLINTTHWQKDNPPNGILSRRHAKNKINSQNSAGNVMAMARVFWGSEGILLVEFVKRSATISSERNVQLLKKLK
jgi:hypothetical protein